MFAALGLGGGNSVCFFSPVVLSPTIQLNDQCLHTQLLAGLAIVIGIPFPIWIYFKGEEMRAGNPLTHASTISKKKPSSPQETELGT
jgi:hypothetical protein